MLLELSLLIVGIIVGGSAVAVVFALDKKIVRMKDNEVLIDENYYMIMRQALGRKGHLHVLRELAQQGKIDVKDVREEDDDVE